MSTMLGGTTRGEVDSLAASHLMSSRLQRSHLLFICVTGGSGLAVEGQPDHVRKLVARAGDSDKAERPPAGSHVTKVTLYKNGFAIDEGEFRDLALEENRKFMDAITEGNVPDEVMHPVQPM